MGAALVHGSPLAYADDKTGSADSSASPGNPSSVGQDSGSGATGSPGGSSAGSSTSDTSAKSSESTSGGTSSSAAADTDSSTSDPAAPSGPDGETKAAKVLTKPAKSGKSPKFGAAAHTPKPAARVAAQTSSGSESPTHNTRTLAAPASSPSVATVATAAVTDSAPAVDVVHAAKEFVKAPVTITASVLDALSTSLFGGSPGGPVESPGVWVLAAAARRQIGESGDDQGSAAAADSVTSGQTMTALAAVDADSPPTAILTKQSAPSTSSGKVTGKVTATDPDGDKLTFATPITTAKGKVTVTSTGTFTYTPTAAARHAAAAVGAPAAAKADSFKISVSDGRGGVATVPVTVTITPANKAPTTKTTVNKPDPVSGVATGNITVTDNDGDTPTFTASAPSKGAVVMGAHGSFVYTPTAAARAAARASGSTVTDKFTVTVNDGHGSTKAVAVKVNIAPSDTAPVHGSFTTGTPSASTGAVKGRVTATDNEGDALKYSGSTDTAKGKVSVSSSGAFTYTPTSAARHAAAATTATTAVKTDSFTLTVKDEYGATATVPVTVTILGKDAAPKSGKTTVGQPNYVTGVVTGTVTATDTDKDAITYTGSATTSGGKVVVKADGTFTYTPTQAARAKAAATGATTADKEDSFTVTASDGHGGATLISVSVPISPNAAPINGQSHWDFGAGTTISGTVTATDPDGDTLTYSGPATTAKGSLTVTPQGAFTYTPTAAASHATTADGAPADSGQDTFFVNVSDGRGAVTPVKVTVVVLGTNDAPNVVNQTYTVNENTQLTGNVLAGDSDPDGDPLTVGFVSGHDHGSLTLNSDGSFAYNPAANFYGTDSFTYTVSDGHGTSQTATANITVNYVAPPSSGPTASQKIADFVNEWSGRTVAGYSSPTVDPGQCVALIDQYVSEKYGLNLTQLNAVRYADGQTNGAVLKNAGWGWHAGSPAPSTIPDGAIVVFGQNAQAQTGPAGHIGIWYSGALFDQNDGWRSNGAKAGLTAYSHVAPAVLGYWSPPGGGGGPVTPPASGTRNGTATVIQLVNVRNDPSTNGPIVAQYSPGQTFNYDSWVTANDYHWLSYVSFSGVRRYVAESRTDGSVVYVTGGVFH